MRDPKPRKRIEDKEYLKWLTMKPCLYCGSSATEPHHCRWGQGPGHGSIGTKPDDYRSLRVCPACHRALHGTNKDRLEWMTQKIGREEIYEDQIKQLMRWKDKNGEDMETLLSDMLDWLIEREAK